MSGIAIVNWRKRAHKRSISMSESESKANRDSRQRFWTFAPSPLGPKNDESARRSTNDEDSGRPKKEDATIIDFRGYVTSPAGQKSPTTTRNVLSADVLDIGPKDEPLQPPPKSRKIVQDLDALLEQEERAEKLRSAALGGSSSQAADKSAVAASPWSSTRAADYAFADLQNFVLAPISEREQFENVLMPLPPPPRFKKTTPAAAQHRPRDLRHGRIRPHLRQASSLPNSPTFRRDAEAGPGTRDHKNIGTSDQEANATETRRQTEKGPGDNISRSAGIGKVSDGQGGDRGGLTDGIELRLDENREGGRVGWTLDWPLAWQWSPIGSFNLEPSQEMEQVDSVRDSSSSRPEQTANLDQTPQTTPASADAASPLLTLPSPLPPSTPPAARTERDKVEETGTRMWTGDVDGGEDSHGRDSVGSMIASDDGEDWRISISSTVYPASDDLHSHSHSLYYTPMPTMADRASFMDLQSPVHHEFNYDRADSPDSAPVSPIKFAESPHSPDLDYAFPPPPKPPVPTAPKPSFIRAHSHSRQASPMRDTPAPTGTSGERKKKKKQSSGDDNQSVPPTTNFLDTDERAELIRKSRKLARVFGETPGADAFAQDAAWRPAGKHLHLGGSATSRRHSMPLSPDDVSFLSIVSPTFDASGAKKEKRTKKSAKDKERSSSKDGALKKALPSPTSFIDLSDEENAPSLIATKPHLHTSLRGGHSFASAPTSPLSPRPTSTMSNGMPLRPPSPTQSLLSTFTVDTIIPDPEEEERRRKRERLAKLHRFLGSRVPANLVLGIDEHAHEATLPPPLDALSLGPLGVGIPAAIASDTAVIAATSPAGGSGGSRGVPKPAWMKRRRSSSAGLLPSFRLGDPSIATPLERQYAELDDKEKAINVRRAHKMEQVFGVAPPQTLFHTRQATLSSPAVVTPPVNPSKGASSSKKSTPTAAAPLIALPPIPAIGAFPDVLLIQRNSNVNRSSYNSRKSSKIKRPGSADSNESGRQTLLPGPSEVGHGSNFDERQFGKHGGFGNDVGGEPSSAGLNPQLLHSFVYNHYQHSLNSLNDILDRDDRESLAELHDYLNSTNPISPDHDHDSATPTATPKADDQFSSQQQQEQSLKATRDRSASIASSLKSERRRSLPTRTSMISIAPSEFSISSLSSMSISPPYVANEFQQRRRRAAKLAQFFGVNYRELVNEVLESIEIGVAQEQSRGTLRAEEVEDLLTKLRTLKVKRSRLF